MKEKSTNTIFALGNGPFEKKRFTNEQRESANAAGSIPSTPCII